MSFVVPNFKGDPSMFIDPVQLLSWAVAHGRIPAADWALWFARLSGQGAGAYRVQLLGGATPRRVTFPT